MMPHWLLSFKECRPFAFHIFFTVFTVIGAICLINPPGANRVYNIDNRRPHFIDLDGWPRTANVHNMKLLQSDIITMLSLAASATRAAAACWVGTLLWRCAFMFMENSEITLTGISKVIAGGPTTVLQPHHVSTRKNWLLIYSIIFICFIMDYFSAILTGSVTWQPVFTLVDGVVPLTNIPEGIPGSDISFYTIQPLIVLQAIELAASLALLSWGVINTNSSNLPVPFSLTRRAVIQAADMQSIQHLPPNSTLGTIQLPYFKVEKFEYITDPESSLTSQQWSLLNDSSPYNPYILGEGFAALFPDARWGPAFSVNLSSPVKVSETRILGILVETPAVPYCSPLPDSTIPQNINPYLTSIVSTPVYLCFIFANMTYTAGAAICGNCKIVASTVVQENTNNLQPIPDPLTIEALAITSSVLTHMTVFSYANPFSNSSFTYEDIAVEFISRAYQSAWSSLVIVLGQAGQNNQTSVMVAVPASHPSVLRWRIYLWAILHMVVLLAGMAFVYFQSQFRHPWVSDPMMAAFILDTSGIFKHGEAADHAMDPWHPDAEYRAGKLKLNDYDPDHPGYPRTVVLVPPQSTSHSSHQELEGESDISLEQIK